MSFLLLAFLALGHGLAPEAEKGNYLFYNMTTCVNTSCYGNNWVTSYVAYGFFPETNNGNLGTFHLEEDEAIVIQFELPPPVQYFGITPYLLNRTYGHENTEIASSLTDTINFLDIADRCGEEFNGTIRFVMTPNIEASAWLSESSRDCVISFDIAGQLLNLGYGDHADWFVLLARFTNFSSISAGESYLYHGSTTVERIRLHDVKRSLFGYPNLIPRSDVLNENYLEASLMQLIDQVIKNQSLELIGKDHMHPYHQDIDYDSGWAGINNSVDLLLDNRDTSYFLSNIDPPRFLKVDDLIVAIGVIHTKSLKALYNNIQIFNMVNDYGVSGFMDWEMTNSAVSFLPDDPLAKDLYVVGFAHNCSQVTSFPCSELTDYFPSGIPMTDPVVLAERIYVTPPSFRGPAYDCVQPAHILHFTH